MPPTLIIVFLVKKVIKKRALEKTDGFIHSEKDGMFLKARSKKEKLALWKSTDLKLISNYMDFTHVKSMTRKFNGYIKSMDDDRLISFRRIDRGGMTDTITRIVAISTDFELFFDQSLNETTIEFNGKYLGKIIDNAFLGKFVLKNAEGEEIGYFDRKHSTTDYYTVNMLGENLAKIFINTDRKRLVKNPVPVSSSELHLKHDNFNEQEVEYYELIELNRQPSEEEYPWILAIAIYEAVYYGMEFF